MPRFWPTDLLACLTSGLLAFWHASLLAYLPSGMPRFWPAGLLACLASGLMVFWPADLLACLASGLLASWRASLLACWLSFDLLVIRHALLLAFWPFWHALHLAFLRLSGLALGSPSLCQHFFRLSGLLQAYWPSGMPCFWPLCLLALRSF